MNSSIYWIEIQIVLVHVIYQLAFDSFIGTRNENQDSVLNIKIAEDIFLVGIADGMGGVKGGKLASSLTVESITDYAQSLSLDQFENENLKNILLACYEIANYCIQKAVEREPEYHGMGTTLCLLLICGDSYVWSSIGDSRIYFLDDEQTKQITVDHTYIEKLSSSNEGQISEEIKGKYEHFLTKCVDGSGEVPDIFPMDKDCEELPKNSNFLLCSDGLILNKIDTDISKLRQIALDSSTVQDAVSDLISYAYSSGSKDNISVGVVRIREDRQAELNKNRNESKSKKLNLSIYLTLILLVLSSGAIFLNSLNTTNNSSEIEDSKVSLPARNINSRWLPLKEVDFRYPLTETSDIQWLQFPNIKSVKYYHLVILDDDNIIVDKYLKHNITFLSVGDLNLTKGKTYTLMVDAIINDNKRIEGNSVAFTYTNAENKP